MTQSDFSVGSVRRLILSQAVPLIVAQVIQLLYNIVDRIYIGHLPGIGPMALTGLGITFPVVVLIVAFTTLFGTGGATLFSLARGRGDVREADAVLGNVVSMLTLFSVLLFAVCYAFRRPILFAFGASELSYYYADRYLKVYLFGTAFSMLSTGLNGFINAQGFPRIGMMTTVIGALLNVVLDPVLIFGLHLDVFGAAVATVISQAVSCIWVLAFLHGGKAIHPIRKEHLVPDPQRLLRIVSLGLPGFVMQGTNSLVQIVCNTQLQMYGGDLYVGIMTILSSVRDMLSVPGHGLCHGSQPILGFNYGAGRNERVKEGIRFTVSVTVVYLLVAWILVLLLPGPLIRLFSSDPETLAAGREPMHIYFFGFVFMALQMSGQSAFQALGKAKQAIFFSLLRKAFIVVPLTLLLPAAGFGIRGVFLAEPVSNLIGGLAVITTMYLTVYRKL